MGKTYFCDYCGRSFQDNLHNRKKHLQGVQHQRAKKFWFDSFRDTATILAEELAKKPCRKFLQSGQCDFGANCKFSHMTDEDVSKLRQKVEEENKVEHNDGRPAPNIDEWLAKRAKRKENNSHSSGLEVEKEVDDEPVVYWLPPGYHAVHELPPSLHPPPPGGWKTTLNVEWG